MSASQSCMYLDSYWILVNNGLILQYGIRWATGTDREHVTLVFPISHTSSVSYSFFRLPRSINSGGALDFGCFFGSQQSPSSCWFTASYTNYYSGDNWFTIGY